MKPLLSPPMSSHLYGIPPAVANNLQSQTTTHVNTGDTVYTIPPRYTTAGDKIHKPKTMITGGVVYPVIELLIFIPLLKVFRWCIPGISGGPTWTLPPFL